MSKLKFRIVENSPFARLARIFMKSKSVAMTLGKSIHISGVSKEDFLKDKKWVMHELVHVEQYRKHGFFTFLTLYLIESIKHGYQNNRFEKEARDRVKAGN